MIFVTILSVLFAIAVLVFVLTPLAKPAQSAASDLLEGFSNEEELRAVISLRDALIEKITTGQSNHPLVEAHPKENCFDPLLKICIRLQRAGLPYLPKLLILVAFIFSLNAPIANAQSEEKTRIPQLIEYQGARFAKLHQFVLSPALNALHVRYVAYFNNPGAETRVPLAFPLPDGARDFKILDAPDAVAENSQGGYPVMNVKAGQGDIHIQAEFFLDANYGVAHWKNSSLTSLPGSTLFMMPEQQGGLRNFLEVFGGVSTNVWPPRIVDTTADFQSTVSQDNYSPDEPNYQMLMKMPPQYTRRVIRFGDDFSNYPSFRVVGLVPERTLLVSIAGTFFVTLLSVTGFAYFRSRKT